MSQGFAIELGDFYGTRIRLDWSLVIIFVLVILHLAVGVLPGWHPSWSNTLTWSVAGVAALLFVVSVLLHELAHTVVARYYDLPVRSITLFVFGGIANIEREPSSAKEEALIALAGPAASVGIGAFSLMGSALLLLVAGRLFAPVQTVQDLGPVTTLLLWLGPVNILLGMFNMLPGFPLDGGRVLRASVFALTRDFDRATRIAARVGQGLAIAFVLLGVAMVFGIRIPVLGTGIVGGLWLGFIGVFLHTAALGSHRQVAMEGRLVDVPVASIMARHTPHAVPGQMPVRHLVDDRLLPGEDSILLVTDESEALRGLVRTADIRRVQRSRESVAVQDLMIPSDELPVVAAIDDAREAYRKLGQSPVDAVLVTDGARVVGVLQGADVARWLELHASVAS